jgi:hypothetical protein
MSVRVIVALVLMALGLLSGLRGSPEPTPAPSPDGGLVLRGQFIGPTAAEDAATLAGLCDELASIIEWDGMLEQPRLKSGVAFDDVRVAAREARCRGESIGARQPRVRQAIEDYLTATVGTSGGPITPAGRSKWVVAYRELGRACADAAR